MKKITLKSILTAFFIGFSSFTAHAEVIFSENFGLGVGFSKGTPTGAVGTKYSSGTFSSGYYALTENSSQVVSVDASNKTTSNVIYTYRADHTGNDGLMLMANVPTGGNVYSRTENLCIGAKYKLTAYVNFLAANDANFRILANNSALSTTITDDEVSTATAVYAYDGTNNRYPVFKGTVNGSSTAAYYVKKGEDLYIANLYEAGTNRERYEIGKKLPFKGTSTWYSDGATTDGAITGKAKEVYSHNGKFIYQQADGNWYLAEFSITPSPNETTKKIFFEMGGASWIIDANKVIDLEITAYSEENDSYPLYLKKEDGNILAYIGIGGWNYVNKLDGKSFTYKNLIGKVKNKGFHGVVTYHETNVLIAKDLLDFTNKVTLSSVTKKQRNKWKKITAEFTCTESSTTISLQSGHSSNNRVAIDDITLEQIVNENTPIITDVFPTNCITPDGKLPLSLSLKTEICNLTYEWSVKVGDGAEQSFTTRDIITSVPYPTPISVKVRANNGCNFGNWYEVSSLTYGANQTTWTGIVDNDWSNAKNWTYGVPMSCSNATITTNGNYPEITDKASCKKITFEPNAGILGLRNLTYDSAFVQANFNANRWYAVTSPLKKMYSGDYYFNGTPSSYLGVFSVVKEEDFTNNVANWSQTYPFLNQNLDDVQGFIYKVENNKSLEFPRRNENGQFVDTLYFYNPITKTIITNFPIALNRGKNGIQFRFAAENEFGKIPTSKSITTQPNNINIIGNPLMSHLDLRKFWASNNNISSIKIFSNGGISSVSRLGIVADPDESFIVAPMQSFFVNTNSTNVNLDFDNHYIIASNINLRSTESAIEPTMYVSLKIDESTSSMALARRESASDGIDEEDCKKTFIDPNLVSRTEVYTIVDGQRLDINVISSTSATIPLGIYGPKIQTVTFAFRDVDTYQDVDVFLRNSLTGEKINLKEQASYKYTMQSSRDEGNLYIEFEAKENFSTLSKTQTIAPIQIRTNHNVIYASCLDEDIETITVMDNTGRIVTEQTINAPTTEVVMNNYPTMYIVRAVTASQTITQKVIIQ